MNTILFIMILMIWHPDGSTESISGYTTSSLHECAREVFRRANQIYKDSPNVKIEAACVEFNKEDAL